MWLLWAMTIGRRSSLERLERIEEALRSRDTAGEKLRNLVEGTGTRIEAGSVTAAEWDPVGRKLLVRCGRVRFGLKVAENHAEAAAEMAARCQEWATRNAGRR